MHKRRVNQLVIQGLDKLLGKDAYLLYNNTSERSIMHKLGVYYQEIFYSYNVDCEFNKTLNKKKSIQFDPVELKNKLIQYTLKSIQEFSEFHSQKLDLEKDPSIEDYLKILQELKAGSIVFDKEIEQYILLVKRDKEKTIKRNISPDIIIHKRGTAENFLAIEIKKTSNRDKADRAFDRIKLNAMLDYKPLKYKCAYFIDLPVEESFKRHTEWILKNSNFLPKVTNVTSSYYVKN
jgi:hypothetical protein